MGNFQKLNVWQVSRNLAVSVYKLTQSTSLSKDYGFKDQIQRSAVSIPSNIAEGDELDSNKQSIHYFYITKASSAELLTQVIIGKDIGYISKQDADKIISECKFISVMLTKLIKARS